MSWDEKSPLPKFDCPYLGRAKLVIAKAIAKDKGLEEALRAKAIKIGQIGWAGKRSYPSELNTVPNTKLVAGMLRSVVTVCPSAVSTPPALANVPAANAWTENEPSATRLKV